MSRGSLPVGGGPSRAAARDAVPPPVPEAGGRPPERVRRSLRLEGEALIAAGIAAVASAAFSAVLFWGSYTPIWADWGGDWTVGAAGLASVVVLGFAASLTSHLRSSRLPQHAWRRTVPLWRALLDTGAITVMHTALAVLAAGTTFFVAQHAFRRLVVGQYVATSLVTVVTALAVYMLYLGVAQLTTVTMAHRLLLFMSGGVLLSMETTSDPVWWRYHFSELGTFGNPPSLIFNATLIVSGMLVAAFALYIERDLATLRERGILRYGWAPPTYSTLFVLMGLFLTGIGVVPIDVTVVGHNVFAGGTTLTFGALLLLTPIGLRGFPATFRLMSLGFFGVLVVAAWFYLTLGYFNLTSFELIAFVALFGWIVVFVRFVAAVLGRGSGTAERAGSAVGPAAEEDEDAAAAAETPRSTATAPERPDERRPAPPEAPAS